MVLFSSRSIPWLFLTDRWRWDRDVSQLLPRSLPPSPEHQQPLHWSLRVRLIHLADSADALLPHIWSQWCSQPFASALFLDVVRYFLSLSNSSCQYPVYQEYVCPHQAGYFLTCSRSVAHSFSTCWSYFSFQKGVGCLASQHPYCLCDSW